MLMVHYSNSVSVRHPQDAKPIHVHCGTWLLVHRSIFLIYIDMCLGMSFTFIETPMWYSPVTHENSNFSKTFLNSSKVFLWDQNRLFNIR